MVCVQRMLLSLLPLLSACTVFGLSQADTVERMLSEHMSMSGKGKGGKGKGGSDDDYVMSMSGKGKGGKGKGGSDDDYVMSMDMSMSGKGKGGKGKGGTSKSSKSTKSSKKGSKKGKGKGGGPDAPSGGGPSPSEPTTPSPTSENSIPIRATPYALYYDGDFSRIPSDEEFASVAELTRVYLEELMIDEFAQTSLTNLDDFITFMIRNSFDFGEPVQADYRSTGLFNPSSIFLPTVRELDDLITEAFTDDSLDEYVSLLQKLPSRNIFSTTSGVMKALPNVPVPRTASDGSTSGSGTFKMGLAAAAAGIVVLAAGAAMLKQRRKGEESLEDPYKETNLKGDAATLAGETCTASLDGSSVWRKSSPYVVEDLDESEFEDEPLESDDEKETTSPQRQQSRQRGLVPPKAAFTS